MKHRLALLLTALPLTACSMGARSADDLYVLHANNTQVSARTLPQSLRVLQPQAESGLDTARIAVRDTPNHLTYYTGAAWAQTLPLLLQSFLIDSLAQSHHYKSVSSDREGTLTDLSLVTDIRDFSVHQDAEAPSVHLELSVKLVNNTTHRAVSSFTVESSAQAQTNKMASIIDAFNQAADEASADIVDRLSHSGAAKKGASN